MINKNMIVFGTVGLKPGRIRNTQPAMIALAKKINPPLISASFLAGAPFDLISVIIREGNCFSETSELGRVDRKHKELPAAFEVPMDELKTASQEELMVIFSKYTVQLLDDIAEKYDLNKEVVASARNLCI